MIRKYNKLFFATQSNVHPTLDETDRVTSENKNVKCFLIKNIECFSTEIQFLLTSFNFYVEIR